MAKNVLAICLLFLFASSVIYEVQGTFLLKMYLKRKFFPRRCRDFTPFACKGMLKLMGALQGGCPATREFKQFFGLFKSYIQFILSITSSSKSIDTEMSTKCDGLAKAMALLSGVKGGVDASSDFKETMFSMGKVLVEQKTSGSIFMRRAVRRELIVSMVKWTRTIVTLVSAAAEKRGKTIDVSSLGLDVDVNSSVGSDDSDESDDESPSSGSPSPKTESQNSGSPSDENESSPSPKTESQNSGSPSNEDESSPSPKTESQNSGSPSNEDESSSSGSATSSRSGSNSRAASGSSNKDTSDGGSGSPSGTPSDSSSPSVPSPSVPSPSVPSDSGETAVKGTASGSGEATTKTKKSATGSTKTKNVNEYSDESGATSGSSTDSPSPSVPSPSVPSPSVPSDSGETSVQGTASGSGEASTKTKSEGTSSNSATTSVKQVEKETSKEVMSFISSLEQKYAGKAELKVFFDKLKSSMSASSKISTTDSKDFISGMKSAAVKLSEAMVFVRSKFSKSEEMKTNMATYQAQLMKTLKELQEINSEIVTQSKGKTVTSSQQTELKQTITKWEQVTTQFVETAASSSSQSSSSQSSYQSQQGSSMMNSQAS